MLKIGEKLLVKNQVWSIVAIGENVYKLENSNGQLLTIKSSLVQLF